MHRQVQRFEFGPQVGVCVGKLFLESVRRCLDLREEPLPVESVGRLIFARENRDECRPVAFSRCLVIVQDRNREDTARDPVRHGDGCQGDREAGVVKLWVADRIHDLLLEPWVRGH